MKMDAVEVSAWAASLLESEGLQSSDAAVVAENLAYAELRGTASHGFIRLPIYVHRIRAGGINAKHVPSLVSDLGALAVLDADDGPGAATAKLAALLASDRAQEFGIGCVLVRNGNHFGAAAFYTEQIADRGLAGIVMCNTDRAVCAPFGGKAVLGTNPMAFGLPVARADRPILDMATSEVAYGKLLVASAKAASIPLGWAVDSEGRPTQNPQDGLDGALLPAAGPKGFGLAFMIDALLALSGAEVSPHVNALHGDDAAPQRLGQIFIAMRPTVSNEQYSAAVASLVDDLRSSRLPASPAVMYPGEPESLRKSASGGKFDVSDELLRAFRELDPDFDASASSRRRWE